MNVQKKPVVIAFLLFIIFGAIANAADMNASYDRASKEFGVPLQIVRGVAYVSSGGVQRQPSTATDRPPAYGVMGLRDDDWFGHSLRAAAALLGVSPDLLRIDADANVRGGTALLARIAAHHPEAVQGDAGSWRGVIAEFSGIPQKDIADLFAQQVLDTIHRRPRPGRIAPLVDTFCSNIVWYGDTIPTTNYAVGRNGVAITMVVIHTIEETAAATLSTAPPSASSSRDGPRARRWRTIRGRRRSNGRRSRRWSLVSAPTTRSRWTALTSSATTRSRT